MHLIVGLGNPGPEHAGQRHNIGYMAADAIARRHGLPRFREKFQGLVTDGTVDGQRLLVLKPQTYMNLSGDSVGAAMRFYKLDPDQVTVIYDEIDLVPGKAKVKTGGGSGGHNGIRSIEAHIGNGFHRVRLGVGHPGHKDRVHGHVLADFARADREWLDPLLDAVADSVALLARGDGANFMNCVAMATRPASGTQAPPAPIPGPVPKPDPEPPASGSGPRGTMADMLSRLFGRN